ncbi:hypothetical protein [Lysinibacillus fusiformis]|uniref:hypothetical protein n=1 Tax=Lysinibacillus fusiformis TaxID=28031 RepID=UPI003D08A7E6
MNLTHDIIYKKTFDNLLEIKRNNILFQDMYTNIFNKFDSCLIGGAIRDFCIDSTPKDLDFVINISNRELFNYISKYDYKINKFGGYKICLNDLIVDIWSIDNHWAFKNNILNKSIENLEYTTFYNIDSLVFNVKSNTLYSDCFLDGYKNKLLDITLKKEYFHLNPNVISNVYKAVKLVDQLGLDLSKTTYEYLNYWKKSCNEAKDEFKSYADNINNGIVDKLTYILEFLLLITPAKA